MDSYQPIYDAVRSRISSFDASVLIERIADQFDISHQVVMVRDAFMSTAYEHQRPSVLFRPKLSIDGNQWCALYGEDLQNGIAGFGDTPGKAMEGFDEQWDKFKAKGA